MGRPTQKRFFFRCVLLHMGLDVVYFIVFGHASTSGSMFIFSLRAEGGGPIHSMCWKNGC